MLNVVKEIVLSDGTKKIVKQIALSDGTKKLVKGVAVGSAAMLTMALSYRITTAKKFKMGGGYNHKERSANFNMEFDDTDDERRS